MKRALLVSFGLIMLGSYAGCLPEETTPTGKGGSQGTAGTGQQGSAGTQGTAGNGTAGTQGSGGDNSGVAGSQGTAGNGTAGNGTAGSGTAGNGTAGSGTAGNGTAGSGTAGNGTAGNGTAGSGTAGSNPRGGTGGSGTAGTAGTGTAGTTSRGGAGGTGGTGGTGSALPDIPTLFPAVAPLGSLDGRLVVMPCGEANASGTDCNNGGGYYSTAGASTAPRVACNAAGKFDLSQVFPVGGETGKIYTVTIHVYGIAEPKNYGTSGGLTRDAGTGRPGNQDTGASPTTWAYANAGHTFNVDDYNQYEIRSCKNRTCAYQSATDETNVYYLNADTSQGHWTYVMNYTKQIKVTGGGAVRVRNYDDNCRMIKNCGPNGTAANNCQTFANNRKITLSAASVMPLPSATAAAPNGGLLQPQLVSDRDANSAGQWVLIDVVSVDSVQ